MWLLYEIPAPRLAVHRGALARCRRRTVLRGHGRDRGRGHQAHRRGRCARGEAVVGAVLLGGSASLSGIVTSVTAASNGSAELAVSNAVGGIAVQTVFLAVADLAYRGVNLEHAAASPANLAQGALLVTLLAVPLLAFSGPEVSLLGVHPATPLLLASYAFGLRVVSDVQADPMWGAERTPETQDEEEKSSKIAVPRARA